MYEGVLLVLHWPSSNDATCTPMLQRMLGKTHLHTDQNTHRETSSKPNQWFDSELDRPENFSFWDSIRTADRTFCKKKRIKFWHRSSPFGSLWTLAFFYLWNTKTLRFKAVLMRPVVMYLSSVWSWLVIITATIFSNACSSSNLCKFFVRQCSFARGRTDGTMPTMTAWQLGQNTRSLGGCTRNNSLFQVQVQVSEYPRVPVGSCWLIALESPVASSAYSQRVQGRDISGLPPSHINVPINCY